MIEDYLVFDEEQHVFYLDKYRIPSVSQIMRHAGIQPDVSFLPKEFLERGSFVHWITELVDQGIMDWNLIPVEMVPFVSAYEMFSDNNKIEVFESEKIVFNADMIYAGILDRVWTINGTRQLSDIKTGTYTKWHKVQLTAYNLTQQEENISSLYLTKEGNYQLKTYPENYPNKGVWEAAVKLYWYSRERDHRAIKKIIGDICK